MTDPVRVTNIQWTLQGDHSFATEADYCYTGSPNKHVPLTVPGQQYDYYLLLAGKIQPEMLVGYDAVTNPLPNPQPEDVARMMHDWYWIVYAPPASASSAPQSGTAPDLT